MLIDVRQRDHPVIAERNEAFDLALAHFVEHLDDRDAGLRQFFFRQAPNLTDVFPVLRIVDRPLARKLVGLLSVFAAALAVSLAGDRSVTAARVRRSCPVARTILI